MRRHSVDQMFVDESSEVRMPLAKQDCCKQQARNADWSCCTDAHLDLQTEASTSSGLSSISDAPHDKKRAAPAQLLQEQRKLLCVSEAERLEMIRQDLEDAMRKHGLPQGVLPRFHELKELGEGALSSRMNNWGKRGVPIDQRSRKKLATDLGWELTEHIKMNFSTPKGRKILLELTTDFIAVQQKKLGKDNPHFQHGFLPCLSKLRAAGDAGKTMASRIGGYKMSHKKTKKNPRAHRPAETQEHGRKLLAEDSIGWGLSSEETYDILDPNRRKIKPRPLEPEALLRELEEHLSAVIIHLGWPKRQVPRHTALKDAGWVDLSSRIGNYKRGLGKDGGNKCLASDLGWRLTPAIQENFNMPEVGLPLCWLAAFWKTLVTTSILQLA